MLSIDPSSAFTRGALLGDRIRLAEHFLDDGVFIRSMASRGALGGLAEATLQAALVMDAAGFDDVLLETVGVGQAEIDIVDHADTVVLALMPGSGDSIQALKAGSHGDSRRDRRQQGRASAHRHDGPGGADGAGARPARRLEGADPQDRRLEGGGGSPSSPAIDEHRAHVEETGTLEQRRARNLRSRGPRAGRRADAPRARGSVDEDPEVPSCSSGSSAGSSTPRPRRPSCSSDAIAEGAGRLAG